MFYLVKKCIAVKTLSIYFYSNYIRTWFSSDPSPNSELVAMYLEQDRGLNIRAVQSIFPFYIMPVSYITSKLIVSKISEKLSTTSLGKCSAYMFYLHHHGYEQCHEWDELSNEIKRNTKLQVRAVRAIFLYLTQKSNGMMTHKLQKLVQINANFKVLRHDKNFLRLMHIRL